MVNQLKMVGGCFGERGSSSSYCASRGDFGSGGYNSGGCGITTSRNDSSSPSYSNTKYDNWDKSSSGNSSSSNNDNNNASVQASKPAAAKLAVPAPIVKPYLSKLSKVDKRLHLRKVNEIDVKNVKTLAQADEGLLALKYYIEYQTYCVKIYTDNPKAILKDREFTRMSRKLKEKVLATSIAKEKALKEKRKTIEALTNTPTKPRVVVVKPLVVVGKLPVVVAKPLVVPVAKPPVVVAKPPVIPVAKPLVVSVAKPPITPSIPKPTNLPMRMPPQGDCGLNQCYSTFPSKAELALRLENYPGIHVPGGYNKEAIDAVASFLAGRTVPIGLDLINTINALVPRGPSEASAIFRTNLWIAASNVGYITHPNEIVKPLPVTSVPKPVNKLPATSTLPLKAPAVEKQYHFGPRVSVETSLEQHPLVAKYPEIKGEKLTTFIAERLSVLNSPKTETQIKEQITNAISACPKIRDMSPVVRDAIIIHLTTAAMGISSSSPVLLAPSPAPSPSVVFPDKATIKSCLDSTMDKKIIDCGFTDKVSTSLGSKTKTEEEIYTEVNRLLRESNLISGGTPSSRGIYDLVIKSSINRKVLGCGERN